MPEYLSPGVYVEEVPSAVKPIAGVSTSTAGFIGLVPDTLPIPPTLSKSTKIPKALVDGNKTTFDLEHYPVVTTPNSYQVRVGGQPAQAELKNDDSGKSKVVFPQYAAKGSVIAGSYKYVDSSGKTKDSGTETIDAALVTGDKATFDLAQSGVEEGPSSSFRVNDVSVRAAIQQPKGAKGQVVINLAPNDEIVVNYLVGPLTGKKLTKTATDKKYSLPDYPVVTDPNSFKVRVDNTPVNATLQNTVDENGKPVAVAILTEDVPTGKDVFADYMTFQIFKSPVPVGQAVLCTNFTEYKNAFGDFTLDPDHRKLTQAVYGFFNNGGTRCYVSRITSDANIDDALHAFELVDEIAIVAAPGLNSNTIRDKIVAHCKNMADRFAILDGPKTVKELGSLTKIESDGGVMPAGTDYAAWYFPWINVFDPAAQKYEDNPQGIVSVPPSGHVAGIYARVDNERGVHKAPANEPVRGALNVTQRLSKAHQDGLNPKGVNCIRVLNDNILIWGARTIGGDANTEVKYINVRRTLLFLKKSIYEGTQWVVFEPNEPGLWKKITRNVTAFLTNVWRSGALFGTTQQEAFYVKCDSETNSQSSIDAGQVVTEIGVAIVRPAEFVIFRISQMAGPSS
ncbi:MAG TPA: phage tail sheath subtilisin-like domain-containing protein [Pyrinomonadaceae bacterium]|nr:phage tail sheath subtilisin-like domain-containing protein [Pyrinomonadaceae bacterium]